MSWDEKHNAGYDEEESYFKKKEIELLEKKREELNTKRTEQQHAQAQAAHWMKCPKCGAALKEVAYGPIMIDRCYSCGVIVFDQGEVELLLESHNEGGVVARLSKIFSTK